MLARTKEEYSRYFNTNLSAVSVFGGFGSLFGGRDQRRDEFSEIIKDRVYLSNLPRNNPFSKSTIVRNEDDAALVMSCVDIGEIAESTLLLEPGAKQINYHVLAMQDVTARVGSVDQVYDALALMSTFADAGKPIHIHCFSGVGRSAMMTALHLSHRYLLGDPAITACIDDFLAAKDQKLNPAAEGFINDLYFAAARYTTSKRNCCQFDSRERYGFAVSVLSEIHTKNQQGMAIVGGRDENYYFLAELVQSPEFKKLQYYCIRARMALLRESMSKFSDMFLSNQEGWHEQLVATVNESSTDEANPFYQFSHLSLNLENDEKTKSEDERVELLRGFLTAMNRVADHHPSALYSQQIIPVQHERPSPR